MPFIIIIIIYFLSKSYVRLKSTFLFQKVPMNIQYMQLLCTQYSYNNADLDVQLYSTLKLHTYLPICQGYYEMKQLGLYHHRICTYTSYTFREKILC
jgi:hypothetical protein